MQQACLVTVTVRRIGVSDSGSTTNRMGGYLVSARVYFVRGSNVVTLIAPIMEGATFHLGVEGALASIRPWLHFLSVSRHYIISPVIPSTGDGGKGLFPAVVHPCMLLVWGGFGALAESVGL